MPEVLLAHGAKSRLYLHGITKERGQAWAHMATPFPHHRIEHTTLVELPSDSSDFPLPVAQVHPPIFWVCLLRLKLQLHPCIGLRDCPGTCGRSAEATAASASASASASTSAWRTSAPASLGFRTRLNGGAVRGSHCITAGCHVCICIGKTSCTDYGTDNRTSESAKATARQAIYTPRD